MIGYYLLIEIGLSLIKNYLVDTGMFDKEELEKLCNKDILYLTEQITIDYKEDKKNG